MSDLLDEAALSAETETFVSIPEWILFHPKLNAEAIRLYATLKHFARMSGSAYPSRELLAAKLGCSTRTIDRLTATLIEAGAIRVIRRWKGTDPNTSQPALFTTAGPGRVATSNLYHVIWTQPPATAPGHAGPPTSPDGGGDKNVTTDRTVAQGGDKNVAGVATKMSPEVHAGETHTPSLREGDPRAHTHTREGTPADGQLDLGIDAPPAAADEPSKKPKQKRQPKEYAPFVAEATAIIDPWWKAQDVKPTNYPRVRSAVVACLKANWAADKIPAALTECGASGYAITHTSLETALNRLNRPAAMQGRKPFTAYQDPPDNSGYGSLKDYLRGLEAQSS